MALSQPPVLPATSHGFVLAPFPLICFAGALVTDIAYAMTANMQWANFSAWLLAAGALLTGLLLIAELWLFFAVRRIRAVWAIELHLFGNMLALALSILDCFVHSRDAWTSVVPAGLVLTALLVASVLVTGWRGWALMRVGTP